MMTGVAEGQVERGHDVIVCGESERRVGSVDCVLGGTVADRLGEAYEEWSTR